MLRIIIVAAVVMVAAASCSAEPNLGLAWDPEPRSWQLDRGNIWWKFDRASIWEMEEDFNRLAEQITIKMAELELPDGIEGAMKALESLRSKWPTDIKVSGWKGMFGPATKPVEVMDLVAKLPQVATLCRPQQFDGFQDLKKIFFLAVGRAGPSAGLDVTRSKLHLAIREAWQLHSDTCRSAYVEFYRDRKEISWWHPYRNLRRYFNMDMFREYYGTTDPLTIFRMSAEEVSEKLPMSGEYWMKRSYEVSEGEGGTGLAQYEKKGDKVRLSKEGRKTSGWTRKAIQNRVANLCAVLYESWDLFRPAMFDLALDESKLDDIIKGDDEFAHVLMALKVCPAAYDKREKLIGALRSYLPVFDLVF